MSTSSWLLSPSNFKICKLSAPVGAPKMSVVSSFQAKFETSALLFHHFVFSKLILHWHCSQDKIDHCHPCSMHNVRKQLHPWNMISLMNLHWKKHCGLSPVVTLDVKHARPIFYRCIIDNMLPPQTKKPYPLLKLSLATLVPLLPYCCSCCYCCHSN